MDAFPSEEGLEYPLGPVPVPEPLAPAPEKEDTLMSSLWWLLVPAGAQGTWPPLVVTPAPLVPSVGLGPSLIILKILVERFRWASGSVGCVGDE